MAPVFAALIVYISLHKLIGAASGICSFSWRVDARLMPKKPRRPPHILAKYCYSDERFPAYSMLRIFSVLLLPPGSCTIYTNQAKNCIF